jgi:hypothetical protein
LFSLPSVESLFISFKKDPEKRRGTSLLAPMDAAIGSFGQAQRDPQSPRQNRSFPEFKGSRTTESAGIIPPRGIVFL